MIFKKSPHLLSTSPFFLGGLVLLLFLASCGSNNTKNDASLKSIKEYYIECNMDELNSIYTSFTENIYIPIKISYNGETRIARMRIRGDTSRKYPKKSLKIKFDSLLIDHVPKILNLNAEYEDKTYIRQYLSTRFMMLANQTCYETTHAKVFINGKFHGLFLQVENMDKTFLKKNNLSPKGNLYKATKDGACLSIFDDFALKWEKKTNKKSDHNDLSKLILDVNTIPDNEYHDFIKKTFEYDELINILALNMFLSNNSTYYHNYYLYHDLYNTGKWKMLPWDMDKTLSYYNWMPYTYHRTSSEWESDNPLVERAILCKPMFKDIKKRIDELHQLCFNDSYVSPIIDSLTSILIDIIPLDTIDRVGSVREFKEYANNEKIYFDKHYKLLQKQFTTQPFSFSVFRFDKAQTDVITFKWQKSEHPSNKKITYILSYGTDFLLTNSSKTTYITAISDTFFTLKKNLTVGTYFWKVTAFDGEYYTDGFNTKNIFEVKQGTRLPKIISKNTTLKKSESPYLVGKSSTIKAGVTLTIEKGVEIHFKKLGTLECYGNIIANGTPNSPITFMPNNTTDYWGHIYFYNTSKKAYLKNVIFKDGTINSKSEALTLNGCSILIEKKYMGEGYTNRSVLIYSGGGVVHIKNSTFIGNGEGEGLVLFHGEATTENSYFKNVPDAIEYIQMNKGVIRNNLVINSPDDAIDLNACNNILIAENVLLDNKDKAISIGTEQYGASIKNIQIKNNLIIRNKTGIAVKDSSVAYISNNTFFKNQSGISAYKKREDYNKGGAIFGKNCIFEKNEKTIRYNDEWSSIKINNSITHNEVLIGENNFKGDPRFIDASGNNFHLRKNSPCIKKSDTKKDLGAFQSGSTTVSFSKIHIKSSKEKNTGDWIKLTNNYNIPVDLSLYKIILTTQTGRKEFVFPIGTTLKPLSNIYVVNKYSSFTKHNSSNAIIIGGFPKISTEKTVIQLQNRGGDIIDAYVFSGNLIKKENITFVSNGVNNKLTKAWKLITD